MARLALTHLIRRDYDQASMADVTRKIENFTDGFFTSSATYDPPNLADGAGATTTVAVTGAVMGDFALASFSNDLQGIIVTAYVSAVNTVSVRFQNESGGPLDLASGTVSVLVIRK